MDTAQASRCYWDRAATLPATYWSVISMISSELQRPPFAAASTAGRCNGQTDLRRCGLGGWRNGLRFDPFKKYGDWSYVDIMLDPLVNALRSAMTRRTEVRGELCILPRGPRHSGPIRDSIGPGFRSQADNVLWLAVSSMLAGLAVNQHNSTQLHCWRNVRRPGTSRLVAKPLRRCGSACRGR